MFKLSRRSFMLTAAAAVSAAPAAIAQNADHTGSIATIAPKIAMQGKLATRTEIVADRGERPIISMSAIDALEQAIGLYEEIVAGGGWQELPNVKYVAGKNSPRILALRQRLVRENYLPFDSLSSDEADTLSPDLTDALKAFQVNHGMAPSGKVDQRMLAELNVPAEARLATLYENLPRIQEHLTGLGDRAILVNIPSIQLETVDHGFVYARHNIVVGKLERPTPSLKSRVTDIVFNPFWNAPASIVSRDIIPKYLADPSYLEQMQIRVFDGVGGPEIDPATIDWANTPADRYHFQQQPGANNALATVKVNFANEFMVYMHDTPHRELFATNARFESSGCVRVDQVRNFISWILDGQDGFDEARFEMITASEEPFTLPVQNPPDVRLMYLTAWATEDGRVNFRPDVYRLDGKSFVLGQPEPVVGL